MHIVTICEAEAAALLATTQTAADQIKEALAATQPQAGDSEEEDLESSALPSRIDAVRAFFEEHHRRRAHAAAANDDAPAAKHAFDPGKRNPSACTHNHQATHLCEECYEAHHRMRCCASSVTHAKYTCLIVCLLPMQEHSLQAPCGYRGCFYGGRQCKVFLSCVTWALNITPHFTLSPSACSSQMIPAPPCTLVAGSSILEEVSSRRCQIHSVAVLAHASAEVATPLLLSATLKVPPHPSPSTPC